MELVEFLLARIAEDEAVARTATAGPWYWEEPSKESWPQMDESLRSSGAKDGGYDATVLSGWGYDASGTDAEPADREHIARWDPARVLAECEAKYEVVSRLRAMEAGVLSRGGLDVAVSELRQVCQFLALPYADHPDYAEVASLVS